MHQPEQPQRPTVSIRGLTVANPASNAFSATAMNGPM